MLDDLLHEAQPLCGSGIDVFPAQVVGERTLVAEPAGQRPAGADLGNQTQAAERGHDHRALAGDGEVAGQRPRQADSGRRAVERGHEVGVRPGDQPGDTPELAADPAPDVGHTLGLAQLLGRRTHHLQVATSAEARVGTGEHHTANVGIGNEGIKRSP